MFFVYSVLINKYKLQRINIESSYDSIIYIVINSMFIWY